MSGMRMSISTTSGRSRAPAATASAPSAASPTTSMPRAVRISRNPVRIRVLVVGDQHAGRPLGDAHGRSSGMRARTR